jgi:hypothetical protein
MGLIGRPGTAAVEGRNRRSCTLIIIFSQGGLGGAVSDAGGERQGLDEPIRGISVAEETEDREGRNS